MLCVVSLLGACGGEETPSSTAAVDSAGVADGLSDGVAAGADAVADGTAGGDDLGPDGDVATNQPLGASCSANSGCASGLCGWGRFGQTCVAACTTGADCDTAHICIGVDPSDAGAPTGCIDRHADLCRPCKVNQDCAGGGTCVATTDGSGKFCATSCVTDAATGGAEKGAGCPKGFLCKPDAASTGGAKAWCEPAAGECLCTPRAIHAAAETSCDVINDAGHCRGARVCGETGLTDCNSAIPAEEVCDGVDNDCDGKTDNDIELAPCKADNPNGSCGGVLSCKAGKSSCSALQPGAEVCDRIDNDCDGETDEGFPNTDGDTLADCVDKDDDGDGVPDTKDNCPLVANKLQENADQDSNGDACDDDDDNDAVLDTQDNCPVTANTSQKDTDGDKLGDACDDDDDGDGLKDDVDNCPLVVNKAQTDTDKDKLGDACDDDDDGDGVLDATDNCPLVANTDQADADNDKLGDACDDDDDGDGVLDLNDNCPLIANKSQLNSDKDKLGDACDDDDDGDGVLDTDDNCPLDANPSQTDTDKDKQGDACDADLDGDGVFNVNDNCPLIANTDQQDTDKDTKGDLCDADDDDDGVEDFKDNCPLIANKDQLDTDKDTVGDACDEDDDGDGVADDKDNCPLAANVSQTDTDDDKLGDVCDLDDDGDGVLDAVDNCPLTSNKDQTDTDGDKIGDACDDDADGDGLADAKDNCPLLANKDQTDTDADGKGDACDTDDDGDGDPDDKDCAPLDKAISHFAKETCGGVDEDCDGSTDESGAVGCTMYWSDTDQDGYGVAGDSDCRCKPAYPYTAKDVAKVDCAPNDKTVNPGAVELCDGKDTNCDGTKDNVAGGCALGAKANPATSCLALLAAKPGSVDGFYWISATGAVDKANQLYCWMTQGGWTRIAAEGDAMATGWSDGKLTDATVAGVATKVHGMWGKGGASQRTYPALGIVHAQLKIGGRYYAIDSWDDEKDGAQVWLAGAMRWSQKKTGNTGGGAGWVTASFTPSFWGKNATNGYWNLWAVVPSLAHKTDSVLVQVKTALNQKVEDESFAFSHLTVWVK